MATSTPTGRKRAVAIWFSIIVLSLTPARTPGFVGTAKLYCGGLTHVVIDSGQFVRLQKAALTGQQFTGWITYGITKDAMRRTPGSTLENSWGLGFRLDDSVTTELHPMLAVTHLEISLSFRNLKPGMHRLELGVVEPNGQLMQVNRYCFSVPAKL
jgi:hypothetical protein